MEHLQTPRLLDERGNPLSSRVEGALRSLVPKFRRQFPAVQDELELTEILEKAGHRIAAREQRSGPIEKLHAYAWVTLRSVFMSWMRRGSHRLTQQTIGSEASEAVLSTVPASSGTAEQIEQQVLLREAMGRLTEGEWTVCNLKMLGYSSEEIAKQRHSSTAAVNMVFSRAKQKLRRVLGVQEMSAPGDQVAVAPQTTVHGSSLDTAETEKTDGESPES
jgi:DNA-directed RNA polymerase specialized sigma24 family protein